jgi:hypothetical protein
MPPAWPIRTKLRGDFPQPQCGIVGGRPQKKTPASADKALALASRAEVAGTEFLGNPPIVGPETLRNGFARLAPAADAF